MNDSQFELVGASKRQPLSENVIIKMLQRVRVVTSPNHTIQEIHAKREAPEFDVDAVRGGKVIGVAQAQIGSTRDKPIKAVNIAKCNALLIRYGRPFRFDLVHNMNGDMQQNDIGSRWSDVNTRYRAGAEAIPISSDRSVGVIATIRQILHGGIVTRKRVEIASGRGNISVVYRPKDNKVLIRREDTQEIQEFDGF